MALKPDAASAAIDKKMKDYCTKNPSADKALEAKAACPGPDKKYGQ